MVIAPNTQTSISIVIPKNATPREAFAAEELQKYIRLICGATLPITTDAKAPAIYIGAPRRNAGTAKLITQEQFEKMCPGPEGIFLRSYGDSGIVIAGSDDSLERGTIYAVYELLEQFFGCSFGAYIHEKVAGGEFIPQKDALDLANISYIKEKADVRVRAGVIQYNYQFMDTDFKYELDIAFADWLCKNRYNYFRTWSNVFEGLKKTGMTAECEKRGILFDVGQHDTIDMFLPQQGNAYFPEPYRQTHPEFYRLEADGSRFVDKPGFFGQLCLCARNEEMIDVFAKNLSHFLDLNPSVKFCALSMKDGTDDMCHCQACRKYTKMENYLYFIRGVARRIADKHPDVKIDIALYTDIWEPPVWLTELEPNIFVHITGWDVNGPRTAGKPDGSCLNDTHFEQNALRWKKFGVDVGYYDYYMGIYSGRQRWLPIADEIQAIAKRIVEDDILGTFTQMEIFNHWNNVFNFFCFGRTLYDTSKSMEDNLALFCRIFGAGGEYVAEIIRYGEMLLDGQVSVGRAGRWLMDHIDKARVYDLYEKALLAAETPAARNNIRMMRMVFRYSDLETRQPEETEYHDIRTYTIPERGELLYMKKHFNTYQTRKGFGVAFPVTGEDNGFTPDKWYEFEKR